MDLSTFVGKLLEEQDGDVLREGVRVLAQALMETEVTSLVGAERHERSEDRTAYRNGTRVRSWDTRVGTVDLAIPKVRPGTYFPSLLQPRRRAEQALLTVVQEAYVHGVSTRKVDDLVKALGLDGLSKSEVSRICADLDPVVEAFRTRRLVGEHPYLWLDATYHKVRIDGRVVSQATVVAIGVSLDGERQILGVDVGASEDGAFWTAFLRSLVKRGLAGVRLVIRWRISKELEDVVLHVVSSVSVRAGSVTNSGRTRSLFHHLTGHDPTRFQTVSRSSGVSVQKPSKNRPNWRPNSLIGQEQNPRSLIFLISCW
jgi:transposase-like protein